MNILRSLTEGMVSETLSVLLLDEVEDEVEVGQLFIGILRTDLDCGCVN